MATIGLTIFKGHKLAKGGFMVYVVLRHNGKAAYVSTGISVLDERCWKEGKVVRMADANDRNVRLRRIVAAFEDKLEAVRRPEMYSATRLMKVLVDKKKEGDLATFERFSMLYVEELEEKGSSRYADVMRRACSTFLEAVGGDMALDDISPSTISLFVRWLEANRRTSRSSTNTLLRHVKVVINAAVKRQLVKYVVHPFAQTKIPAAAVREADLSLECFNAIRTADLHGNYRLELARDLFMLSFYLGGMNLVDLLETRFCGEKVLYRRKKTAGRSSNEGRVELSIPPEAQKIIERWADRDTGRITTRYKLSYDNLCRYVTRTLKLVVAEAGFNERVMFYSARKSFAQYASELGIPDAVIDYCLGHSGVGRGVIRYYARVKRRQADIAVSRVIDYVKHPEKYEAFIEMRMGLSMIV